MLTSDLHLAPRSTINGAIPPLPPCDLFRVDEGTNIHFAELISEFCQHNFILVNFVATFSNL